MTSSRARDESVTSVYFVNQLRLIVQSSACRHVSATSFIGMPCHRLTVLVVKVVVVQVRNFLMPVLHFGHFPTVDAVHANQGVHVAQAAAEWANVLMFVECLHNVHSHIVRTSVVSFIIDRTPLAVPVLVSVKTPSRTAIVRCAVAFSRQVALRDQAVAKRNLPLQAPSGWIPKPLQILDSTYWLGVCFDYCLVHQRYIEPLFQPIKFEVSNLKTLILT